MIQFLEDLKGVGTPPITGEDREELERLRREQIRLKKLVQEKDKGKHHHEKEADSGSDESEVC